MVVDLCLPHFGTTVTCNKLCADGYDVSNLLSRDVCLRRRGFRLEYFLRPPVHLTLCFRFRVDLCRVDVTLWPPGLDGGGATRGVELHTCSDTGQDGDPDQGCFQLAGRSELRGGCKVSFGHSRFRPHPPFHKSPPTLEPEVLQGELWGRGGPVSRLRVRLPFGGGSGSPLGLRGLAVWGVPARCCPPQVVEGVLQAQRDAVAHTRSPPPSLTRSPSSVSSHAVLGRDVPQEFLDPLTQEVMTLPLLLPSGVVVDVSSLEQHQQHEAGWGRAPSDPFTGIPFTPNSKPQPVPELKERIDRFLLQGGAGREGQLGREDVCEQPRPSRLTQAGSVPVTLLTGADGRRKREQKGNESNHTQTTHSSEPEIKKQKTEGSELTTDSISVSHEQRLTDSLDQALRSALQNRPAFTSQPIRANSSPECSRCSVCSCGLTAYAPCTAAFLLPCGHLICRSCLSHTPVCCPTCKSPVPSGSITRVHY